MGALDSVPPFGTPGPGGGWTEEITYRSVDHMSPLAVNVDWEAMVERHGGDTGKAFEELGLLKDFFA